MIVHHWIRAISLHDICFTMDAHGDYRRNRMLRYKHIGTRCNLIKRLQSAFCLDTREIVEERILKRHNLFVVCFGFEGRTAVFFAFLIKMTAHDGFTTNMPSVCLLLHCVILPQLQGQRQRTPVKHQFAHRHSVTQPWWHRDVHIDVYGQILKHR